MVLIATSGAQLTVRTPALWERRDKAQACSSTRKCTGASLASTPKTPFTGQR